MKLNLLVQFLCAALLMISAAIVSVASLISDATSLWQSITIIMVVFKRVIKVINDIKYNHINIAEDYYVWMKIGMALYNTFGEDGRSLYHIISSQSAKYDPDECNRNYDEMFIYKYSKVNISTLFYFYNQAKKAVA